MGIINLYGAAGKIASRVMLNYSKNQYLEKIEQLEGYCQKLNMHLAEMDSLQSEINSFWNDLNAQKVTKILTIEINAVRRAMETTQETIKFYRETVESFDETQAKVDENLDNALSFLNLLG